MKVKRTATEAAIILTLIVDADGNNFQADDRPYVVIPIRFEWLADAIQAMMEIEGVVE